jgi:hypothetical protein
MSKGLWVLNHTECWGAGPDAIIQFLREYQQVRGEANRKALYMRAWRRRNRNRYNSYNRVRRLNARSAQ